MASRKKSRAQWFRADLHIHTPSSADYLDTSAVHVDILRKAEARNIDIIAFTDHNTVNGYGTMMRHVEELAYLERLGRAQPDEVRLLGEYRRLLDKILVLPGFEFTATFGFHVLGIFSPATPLRQLEHLLLSLNIPLHALDAGSSEVGASTDVLTAYRTINEAGGICIAAHVNSAHGVAMRGLDFGGQTRIAYTQDRYLHALEVTDLDRGGRQNTQRFFDGTKQQYPRRMRCIQGSDAHAPNTTHDKAGRVMTLGVGERATEVLLPERSFDALLEMFQSTDFSRSRPYKPNHQPVDYIQSAREEGPTVVQSFHETIDRKGSKLYNVIADVCAFANTNGGTVYIGLSPDKKKQSLGVQNPAEIVNLLQSEIAALITPSLRVEIDTQETQGKTIIRIQVPSGSDRPYAVENSKIYVRDEGDTSLAIRDEIVSLVRQAAAIQQETTAPVAVPPAPQQPEEPPPAPQAAPSHEISPPTAGVEIFGVEQRNNVRYYIMRDLRNGNIVKNVTRSSARRLWHYAINQYETNPVRTDRVQWHGDIGLWRRYKKSGDIRYDLVQREEAALRIYYGVTDNGMPGPWAFFIAPETAPAEDDES